MHDLFAGYGGTLLVIGTTGALLLLQSRSRSTSNLTDSLPAGTGSGDPAKRVEISNLRATSLCHRHEHFVPPIRLPNRQGT